MISMIHLRGFAKESNAIEGIVDARRTTIHAEALEEFLKTTEMGMKSLETFVNRIEPTARLRVTPADDVMIGGRIAPQAPGSLHMLHKLLDQINAGSITAWNAHNEYERIHPFTDGNGRSGRAVWLWIMDGAMAYVPELKFLHHYYYQTLRFTLK